MEQLPEFLLNHPFLATAFVALVGALVWTSVSGSGSGGGSRLSPSEATRLISHEDALVLDLRGDGEYRGGHIVNAMHLPADRLDSSLRKLEKHRGRPIVVACENGQRSSAAVKTLKAHGFDRVYTLNGGMAAWANASLPLSERADTMAEESNPGNSRENGGGEGGGAPEGEASRPPIVVHKIYVKDLSFECPSSPAVFNDAWQPQVEVSVQNGGRKVGERVWEVVLSVTITARMGEKVGFLVEVQQAGLFELNAAGDDDEAAKPLIASRIPPILYPYARETVTSLVSRGGFPPLLLGVADFESMFHFPEPEAVPAD